MIQNVRHEVIPSVSQRLIVVGDVHGCLRELEDLLEACELEDGDLVVSVGDLIDRGPNSVGVLDLWKTRGYMAIRGNHENRLLDYLDGKPTFMGDGLKKTLGQLDNRTDLITYIRNLPLTISVPFYNIIIVHAGVMPGADVRDMNCDEASSCCLSLRYITPLADGWRRLPLADADPVKSAFWADHWCGPELVVFGHTPHFNGKVFVGKFAIGLDTACVYGERLSAAIHDGSEWSFRQVKAREVYWTRSSGNPIVEY